MTDFPRLYKQDSKGRTRIWELSYVGGIAYKRWGLKHGTILEHSRELSYTRAQGLWNKQLDKGYSTVEGTEPPLRPMLAHKWQDYGAAVNYPVFGQPKLDGVRAICKDGKLHSRNGKHFEHLDHLAISEYENCDGEIYVHGWTFNRIISAVKRNQEDTQKLLFVVFDKISPLPFRERLLKPPPFTITTRTLGNKTEVDEFLQAMLERGFEGIVLRPANGLYEAGKRSKHLLKYKPARKSSEFEIVGYEKDADDGVVWVCESYRGHSFSVRPMGSLAERQAFYCLANSEIGKMLTVVYQELTPDGIPRFPVGKQIRDYE